MSHPIAAVPYPGLKAPSLSGFVCGLVALLAASTASSDAIVRSQAMRASTIAELFVEAEGVRVELEIAIESVPAFRNLLPDALYEKLDLPPKPLAERILAFVREDLVIATSDGTPLPGRLVSIAPRPKLQRDEITGEPLPAQADEDPPLAVFAELFYPFSEAPDTLRPEVLQIGWTGRSGAVDIGFVAYHQGIPVNDFRYLTTGYVLELDWDDPWYSRFARRNLRRTYAAPMQGFLYVEPYEVRKEIILRPRDLEHWIDLGLGGRDTIPASAQPELLRRIAAFLRERQPVTIDGEVIEPELLRANFLRRTLRSSSVVDPPEDLPAAAATVGVIFAYPTPGMPDRATLHWDLWSDRIQNVPVAAVDPAGPLPSFLDPENPDLVWQNFIRFPVMPSLSVNEAPPGSLARTAGIARWPLAALGLFCVVLAIPAGPRRRPAGTAALVALILASASFTLVERARVDGERAERLVTGLLHNVYRAFDFRDEGQTYDVLARSASGDLLEQLYLDTRRSLEIASQGGARARVKEIELIELEIEPGDGADLLARARWNVGASVGHWGHVHRRTNQYHAELGLAPIDGEWKLTRLSVLEESRL